MSTEQQEPSRRGERPRSRLLVPALLAVGALVVVGVILAATGVFRTPAPTPSPVVLPTPTPTVAPAERETTTPFQQAVPDTVLEFAVASQAEDVVLIDAGAVEAYRLEYTDGATGLVLRAGQWPTPDDAAAGAEALGVAAEDDGDASSSAAESTVRDEPVVVGGDEVGRVAITATGDAGRALWTNGATLFELRGPAAVVETVYDAFPM